MSSTRRLANSWPAISFLRELIVIYPVYALMMTAAGISAIELSWLLIIWSATALVLEVPAGALADRLPRLPLLIAACLLRSAAFLCWLTWPTFAGFATGFVLWGAASSLWSGTAEALLYETLASTGASAEFGRIYSHGSGAASVGIAAALLTGGALAATGYTLPLAASATAPLLLMVLLVATFGDPPRTATADGSRQHVRLSVTELRQSRPLLLAAGTLAGGCIYYGVLEEYTGLIFTDRGASVAVASAIWAAFYGVRALAQALAAHGAGIPAQALLLVGGTALVTTALSPGISLLFAGMAAFYICNAVAEVNAEVAMQQRMSGAARATITSIAKATQTLIGLPVYAAIGFAAMGAASAVGGASRPNWDAAVWVCGSGAMISGLVLHLLARRAATAR